MQVKLLRLTVERLIYVNSGQSVVTLCKIIVFLSYSPVLLPVPAKRQQVVGTSSPTATLPITAT
jgi:hypothetical protein